MAECFWIKCGDKTVVYWTCGALSQSEMRVLRDRASFILLLCCILWKSENAGKGCEEAGDWKHRGLKLARSKAGFMAADGKSIGFAQI